MLETLISLVASPAVGAGFGFLGSFFTKREERKNLELTFKHEQSMATINADNRRKELTLEGDNAERKLDAESFFASQKYGNQGSNGKWLSVFRPLIAMYLITIATYMTYQINSIVGGLTSLPASDLFLLYKSLIDTFMFLLTTSVTWLYGSRPSSKRK